MDGEKSVKELRKVKRIKFDCGQRKGAVGRRLIERVCTWKKLPEGVANDAQSIAARTDRKKRNVNSLSEVESKCGVAKKKREKKRRRSW